MEYETKKLIIAYKPNVNIATGYILEWFGQEAPEGWLFCEGQVLSQTEYPELFEVVGTAYNNKYTIKNPDRRWYQFRKPKFITVTEKVPGLFRLPDLRVRVLPEPQQ